MRVYKIMLILLIGLNFSCSKGQNKSEHKAKSIEKEVYKYNEIDINSVEEFENERNKNFGYEIYKTIIFDLDYDNIMDTVRLLKLSNWADPGDYHKIEIKTKNSNYSLSNVDGWVDIENVKVDLSENKYNLNSILIVGDKSFGSYIFLTGYPYASDPPLLSLLQTTENTELVFNIKSYFTGIYNDASSTYPILRIGSEFDNLNRVKLSGNSLYNLK